jgi:hypothetical protein
MNEWDSLSPVEKVLKLCEMKSIAPSKVEKDLGFGNGYLNPKKVKDIKLMRLEAILDYLGVGWYEFLSGEEKPATNGDGNLDAEKLRLIGSLFEQLTFEKQVEAVNWLRNQAQSQKAQDDHQEV